MLVCDTSESCPPLGARLEKEHANLSWLRIVAGRRVAIFIRRPRSIIPSYVPMMIIFSFRLVVLSGGIGQLRGSMLSELLWLCSDFELNPLR